MVMNLLTLPTQHGSASGAGVGEKKNISKPISQRRNGERVEKKKCA